MPSFFSLTVEFSHKPMVRREFVKCLLKIYIYNINRFARSTCLLTLKTSERFIWQDLISPSAKLVLLYILKLSLIRFSTILPGTEVWVTGCNLLGPFSFLFKDWYDSSWRSWNSYNWVCNEPLTVFQRGIWMLMCPKLWDGTAYSSSLLAPPPWEDNSSSQSKPKLL